jgi:hypothetical protein
VNLVVIVPSRGRPRNIAALADAWTDTKAAADVIVAVDDDDPTRGDYLDVVATHPRFDIVIGPRLRMAGTLNKVAVSHAPLYDAVGFMGDDHRPRTPDWDDRVTTELDRLGTGLVYGDDLIQGANLPTAVFMTADIIRTLGWMAPPGLVHLFLDNSWLTLGRALGAISYLHDVVIEHCHPIAGKAAHDDGYAEANAADVWAHDQAVFEQWRDEQLAVDVAQIRTAVRV